MIKIIFFFQKFSLYLQYKEIIKTIIKLKNYKIMANSIGVHVVGTEITEKQKNNNREKTKIMPIEKAMGKFCKIFCK